MIGRWLVERDSAITARVRLATKVAPPDLDGPGGRFDAAFLEEKFSGSLDRLGVETVEFLLTHAPDDDTPIERDARGARGDSRQRPLPLRGRVQRRCQPAHRRPRSS